MATGFPFFHTPDRAEAIALRGAWGWLLAWGVLLLVVGTVALVYPALATLVTVEVLGVLLLMAAGAQFGGAFWARGWGGVLYAVLAGLLYLFAGAVLLERPALGAAGYTLFLSMLFFAGGVLRIVAAVSRRFYGYWWNVLSGVVGVLLGLMIWQDFPASTLWVIGTFVGIDLIFAGWAWVMLALAVHDGAKTTPV
ncbi:MAG TPA: HdeD family acid-resistance protein [Urbifossiella sp.]|jgi:uncharacterized membrane protein HdeD (DUF308 family)|nr:HdeD family acid-resistance protein [Urbifossiella sp.]